MESSSTPISRLWHARQLLSLLIALSGTFLWLAPIGDASATQARHGAAVSFPHGSPEEAVPPMSLFKPTRSDTTNRSLFSRLRGRNNADPPGEVLPLGHPQQVLLQLSPTDAFTVEDSFSHVHICGRAGSGKSSTVGDTTALAMLRQGYGGLVVSAKPERDHWQRLCRAAGREYDLIVIDAHGNVPFNFLDYMTESAGPGYATEAADLLMEGCKAAAAPNQRNAAATDPFWTTSATQLLTHAIRLLYCSGVTVTVPSVMNLLQSLPTSSDDVRDEKWWNHSFAAQCIRAADERLGEDDPERQDFNRTSAFILKETAAWGDKTRSSIIACVSAPADALMSNPLRQVLCGGLAVRPEDAVLRGKILLVDLPSLQIGVAGRIANAIIKRSFMDAAQRRDPSVGPPVFIWSDEAHENLLSNNRDATFAATARSQRCALVYLTQGRTNYDAVIGKESASSLLGNFATHFGLSNGCVATNQWFAQAIGKVWTAHTGISQNNSSHPGQQGQAGSGSNISESFDDQFPAQRFTVLRACTPQTGGLADAVCLQSGRVWRANGLNHLPVVFQRVELP